MKKGKIDKLPFYIENDLVGYLIRTGGVDAKGNAELSFVYDGNWKGGAISPVLPLDGNASPENVRTWFRELMPDDRRRNAFEHMTRLSLRRVMEFLFWFGEDLPGNLSVKPSSEKRQPEDITRFISLNIGSGGSLDRATFGTSLGGGEPKASVIVKRTKDGIRFLSATSEHPSTHIVKASGTVSAIEDCSMKLAAAMNLFPVVRTEPFAIDRKPFLLIERFDRKRQDGRILKLAQEDFCQAIGNPNRYGGQEDGITMEEIVAAIRERVGQSGVRTFLRMHLFSMFIGNSDDHAGNYAFLRKGNGLWDIAPAYDMVSVATLKNIDDSFLSHQFPMLKFMALEQAMNFGNHYDGMEIDSGDILMAGELFHLEPEEMRELVMECHSGIRDWLTPGFMRERKDEWGEVKLDKLHRRVVTASLKEFPSTIVERADALHDNFESAFRDIGAPRP